MDQESNHDQVNNQSFKEMIQIIRSIHNQKHISTINNFGSNLQQNTLTNIMRLAYNRSQTQFNRQNNNIYFQQPQFIISQNLRIIGELTQTLASLCHFQGLSQSIATFNTSQFLQDIDNELQYYVKGIYPKFNVHIDNVPLYVPVLNIGQSYQAVGNPQWETSREMMEKIVLKKIISSEGQIPQWYRLLTGESQFDQLVICWRVYLSDLDQSLPILYGINSETISIDFQCSQRLINSEFNQQYDLRVSK